ncbi:MAG TPA: hypothetical protein VHY58_01290 [Streptosporangiaceae bacterium]|jgi:hypothetical protein|nr:hypothetical protein [Streptosporangiaceae bacterium]
MTTGKPKPLTVGELVKTVLGRDPKELPAWPPDTFAVAAIVLKRTGAYLRPVASTGPASSAILEVAEDWRAQLNGNDANWSAALGQIRGWWSELLAASDVPTDDLLAHSRSGENTSNAQLSRSAVISLRKLLFAADEACRGARLLGPWPTHGTDSSAFYLRCAGNLFWGWWRPPDHDPLSSLCEEVHPTRAIVLPKVHATQAGLTLNSLSRHLALCDVGTDVAPVWRWIPSTYHLAKERAGINVLVIPQPSEVHPRSFSPARTAAADPQRAGYFSCAPGRMDEEDRLQILAAADLAEEQHGRLDAIVLPEMATDTLGFEKLCHDLGRWAVAADDGDHWQRDGMVVVAGVADPVTGCLSGEPASQNKVAISFRLAGLRVAPDSQQSKHHRWRLDADQIRQYGLGTRLDPRMVWWEDIDISQHPIYFWSMAEWLTMSVLICEDLARQEPVAEVVRAVGPNLVMALLADGPQLRERWSARYATILADDPGCAVLTVTSLGMAKLSRPPGKAESRVIALWKDATEGAVEINLPAGAFGVVLSLTREPTRETTTIDGRTGKTPARLKLSGIHPVSEENVNRRKENLELPDPEPLERKAQPMLQPYQSTALSIALFSLIQSGFATQPADDFRSAWDRFNVFSMPDSSQADSRLWDMMSDASLKSFVVDGLFGGEATEPQAQALAHEIKELVRQIRARAPAKDGPVAG